MGLRGRGVLKGIVLAAVAVAALAAASAGSSATIEPGEFIVADMWAYGGSGSLAQVNPVGGAQTRFYEGVGDPLEVAVGVNGEVFALDSANGETVGLFRVDPASGAKSVIVDEETLPAPSGMAVDPTDGTVLATDGDQIIRIDPATGDKQVVASGAALYQAADVAVSATGQIYVLVVDYSTYPCGCNVVQVDPDTGAVTMVASVNELLLSTSIAVEPSGNLIVADIGSYSAEGDAQIIRVTPGDPATKTVVSDFSDGPNLVEPHDVMVAANGDIYVADAQEGNASKLVKVNPTTGAQTVLSNAGENITGVTLANFMSYRAEEYPWGSDSHWISVYQEGSDLVVYDGSEVARAPLADVRALYISGEAADDRLYVYSTTGGFSLPGGIHFDGGGGNDKVVVSTNAAFTRLTDKRLDMGGVPVDLAGVERVELTGGETNNELDLTGWSGTASFKGGTGADTVTAIADTDFTLTRTSLSSPSRGTISLSSVERGLLTGGPGNNVIDASAFPGVTTLVGKAGNDVLLGGAGNDYITGGSGDDELHGGPGSDMVVEEGDVDFRLTSTSLIGRGIDELDSIEEASLTGGPGDNTFNVTGWAGLALLDGGGGIGNSVVSRNNANFTLTDSNLVRSTGGFFTLVGIDEALLTGGGGANTLDASAFTGQATLRGAVGSDVLIVGAGDDTVLGGTGTDRVQATGDVSFTLTNSLLLGLGEDFLASIERATLNGGAGNNTIDARLFSGAVVLNGDAGADTLRGSPFGDTLTGGPGADRMYGYAGNDIFNALDSLKDFLDGGSGRDTCSCDPVDTKRNFP